MIKPARVQVLFLSHNNALIPFEKEMQTKKC